MGNTQADDNYIPPTFLHSLKYHLAKKGRSNVNERDKKLMQYIRSLQEMRRKPGNFRLF